MSVSVAVAPTADTGAALGLDLLKWKSYVLSTSSHPLLQIATEVSGILAHAAKEPTSECRGYALIRGLGLLQEQLAPTLSAHPILGEITVETIKVALEGWKEACEHITVGARKVLAQHFAGVGEILGLSKLAAAAQIICNPRVYRGKFEEMFRDFLVTEIETKLKADASSAFEEYLGLRANLMKTCRALSFPPLPWLDLLSAKFFAGKNLAEFVTTARVGERLANGGTAELKGVYDSLRGNARMLASFADQFYTAYRAFLRSGESNAKSQNNEIERVVTLEERVTSAFDVIKYNWIVQQALRAHCDHLKARDNLGQEVADFLDRTVKAGKETASKVQRVRSSAEFC